VTWSGIFVIIGEGTVGMVCAGRPTRVMVETSNFPALGGATVTLRASARLKWSASEGDATWLSGPTAYTAIIP